MKKTLFLLLFSLSLFAQERSLQIVPDTLIRPRPNLYGLAARNNNLYLVPRTGNMIKLLKENFPGSAYVNILGTVTTGVWNATLISVSYGGTGASTASGARFNLGLGTLATQNGTFSGTSSGTNTGDQTITLTGDVTGSGTGSFAVTIANGVVTLAKMANVATGTILGRITASTGNVEVLSAANVKSILSLGNVENTALSTWTGSTNITTLGTITAGTWTGTPVGNAYIATALTGKTYNGLSVTASTGTLTVENGKTATISNTLTFAGTDGSILNIGAGGTLNSLAFLATVNNSNWSGTALSIANGGSGATSAQGAINAFAGAVTSGSYLRGNGTNVVMNTIQAGDLPTAIDATKIADGSVTSTELQYIGTVTSNVQTQLDAKAALASPALTGTPTAPTAASGTNTTQIATTAFVEDAKTKTLESIEVAFSDETTAITTGTAKVTFYMPYAMTVTEVFVGLSTAQSSGSIFTVDINEAGSTILSTKLTVDNTESGSNTAATAAVVSDTSLAKWAKMTIDVDQSAGTATGGKVIINGYRQ